MWISDAAYVFVTPDGGHTWSQTTKLVASDGATTMTFGTSVSISSRGIAVGSSGDDDQGTDTG
jgi:hypothetical protein